MSARLGELSGEKVGDALVDGTRNSLEGLIEYVKRVRDNPQALLADRQPDTSRIARRQFPILALGVAVIWAEFLLDEDQSFGALDLVGVLYVSSIIYGVLR
jgi:hypothetical protein